VLSSQTLYSSPLVHIGDVLCTEGCGHGRHEERCQANSLALVRHGTFVRRDRLGRHVADATRAVFFNGGEPYTMDHPLPGGDRCTSLVFAEPSLREALRHRRGEGERPFSGAMQAVTPELQLVHRKLLSAAKAGDALAVEEGALRVLELCVTGDEAPYRRGPAFNQAAHLAAEAQVLVAGLFTERLTLERLAAELGVSPFRLCRAFRRATGGSLHRHLTDLRLAAALEKLPAYRERLTDLALDLGFSSHSHFTQAFRSRYGCTPSSWLQAA
jgi:AraC family transcriptional regulator